MDNIKTKSMKNSILTIFLIFVMFNLSAQEVNTTKTRKNEFGIHAGATTGIGMSYRHWFGKAGFQLTALPIKTDNFTFISTGASLLYTFYDADYVRVFGYLGGHYYQDRHSSETYNPVTNVYETEEYDDSFYNFGFGPGFAFGTVVRFNLMVGYGFYDVTESFDMYPTGEIGLYYRF
jgi:hypothetical protein